MFPEDDFLLSKPVRRESVTIRRIALMALIGCLALMSVLMIQARAETDIMLHGPASTAHSIDAEQSRPHPVKTGP